MRRTHKELVIGAGGAWFSYAFGGGGGNVVETGSWRTIKPIIHKEKCMNCGLCEIFCPDNAIIRTNNEVNIDYRYCKGCGICMNECQIIAIEMVRDIGEKELFL